MAMDKDEEDSAAEKEEEEAIAGGGKTPEVEKQHQWPWLLRS